MNASESSAVIAAIAAAVSAGATTWYGLLTLRLVRSTKTSLDVVNRQTEELLRSRIDARAPRLAIRSAVVEERPELVVGADGRGRRHITESTLPLGNDMDERVLVVNSRVTIANEGNLTARLTLPANAAADRGSGRIVILAPGETAEIRVQAPATLSEWAAAALHRRPVQTSALLVADDSFLDGVIDRLELRISAYAVGPGESPSHVSIEPEVRAALGLTSSIDVLPIRRGYRTLLDSKS